MRTQAWAKDNLGQEVGVAGEGGKYVFLRLQLNKYLVFMVIGIFEVFWMARCPVFYAWSFLLGFL
jgi:hypothetical protein